MTTLTTGDEFRAAATPSQALLLKLANLADSGSGAVRTPFASNTEGASARRTASNGGALDMMQFLAQQRREQIADLNRRLDDLDRRSDEELHVAQERLAEIIRTANHGKDGRAIFEDEDGKIYDEQGKEVGADDVDWENWNPEGPGWGVYQGAVGHRDAAEKFHDTVTGLKDRLNGDMSDDDMKDVTDEVAALENRAPDFAGASMVPEKGDRSTSAAKQYDGQGGFSVSLATPFVGAAVPIYDSPAAGQPAEKPAIPFTPD